MNIDRIFFSWGVGPYGWGVVGINFMLYWPGDAYTKMGMQTPKLEFPLDHPRAQKLKFLMKLSGEWQKTPFVDKTCPIFWAPGHDLFVPESPGPSVEFLVFEDVDALSMNIEFLRERCPTIITASRWNHDVLAELGIPSHMVHQGYDPVLFNPSVRKKRSDGRFRVFSGGKAEWRKGQDIVLEGFRIFAQRHDDAVLHAAWDSPFRNFAKSLDKTPLGAPPGAEIGLPNFAAWAQKAGIKPHQFVNVPLTPNHMMPQVLAEIDCAVFASRIEGGTNIAAMECLGCGIPTVTSPTTGHLDLPTDGWHMGLKPEVSADDVAAGLEAAYAGHFADDGVREIEAFAWPVRIAELVGVLKDE